MTTSSEILTTGLDNYPDDDGLERAAERAAEGEGDAHKVVPGVRVGCRKGSRSEIVGRSRVPQDCVVAVLGSYLFISRHCLQDSILSFGTVS